MGWVRVERADTTNLVCRLHAMLRRLRLPSIAAPQPHCWPQRALNTAILAIVSRAGKRRPGANGKNRWHHRTARIPDAEPRRWPTRQPRKYLIRSVSSIAGTLMRCWQSSRSRLWRSSVPRSSGSGLPRRAGPSYHFAPNRYAGQVLAAWVLHTSCDSSLAQNLSSTRPVPGSTGSSDRGPDSRALAGCCLVGQ